MPKLPPRNKRPKVPSQVGRKPAPKPIPMGLGGRVNLPSRPYAGPSYTPPSVVPSTGTNASSGVPGTPGLPVDPIFSNDLGSAQRTHDTTVSGLLTQRANTAAAYGYTPTYDEQGLIRSLAVDPNNPYAKANLLKKSYTEGRARNLNSFAARGQLYAGSLGVAQNMADEGYQQGSNALQNSFINFIANNQGQINAANTNWINSNTTADSDRVARASANDTGETGNSAPSAAAGIPDGTYSNKTIPAGLLTGTNKLANGYVVVVKGGKVVQLRKQK